MEPLFRSKLLLKVLVFLKQDDLLSLMKCSKKLLYILGRSEIWVDGVYYSAAVKIVKIEKIFEQISKMKFLKQYNFKMQDYYGKQYMWMIVRKWLDAKVENYHSLYDLIHNYDEIVTLHKFATLMHLNTIPLYWNMVCKIPFIAKMLFDLGYPIDSKVHSDIIIISSKEDFIKNIARYIPNAKLKSVKYFDDIKNKYKKKINVAKVDKILKSMYINLNNYGSSNSEEILISLTKLKYKLQEQNEFVAPSMNVFGQQKNQDKVLLAMVTDFNNLEKQNINITRLFIDDVMTLIRSSIIDNNNTSAVMFGFAPVDFSKPNESFNEVKIIGTRDEFQKVLNDMENETEESNEPKESDDVFHIMTPIDEDEFLSPAELECKEKAELNELENESEESYEENEKSEQESESDEIEQKESEGESEGESEQESKTEDNNIQRHHSNYSFMSLETEKTYKTLEELGECQDYLVFCTCCDEVVEYHMSGKLQEKTGKDYYYKIVLPMDFRSLHRYMFKYFKTFPEMENGKIYVNVCNHIADDFDFDQEIFLDIARIILTRGDVCKYNISSPLFY
jgi:hypothetical protein